MADVNKSEHLFSDSYEYCGIDTFRVEVKPIVGDNCPAILRTMKAVKTKQRMVGEYCGASATWGDVVKVFALSGITVVQVADEERIVVRDTFGGIEFTPLGSSAVETVVDLDFSQLTERKIPSLLANDAWDSSSVGSAQSCRG